MKFLETPPPFCFRWSSPIRPRLIYFPLLSFPFLTSLCSPFFLFNPKVIPTPTIDRADESAVIYQTGTSKLVINGTNFREKVRRAPPLPRAQLAHVPRPCNSRADPPHTAWPSFFVRVQNMDLVFDPALERNKDYILSVKSDKTMVLTRMTSAKWREEPGPLKLRRINTGKSQGHSSCGASTRVRAGAGATQAAAHQHG